MCSNTVFDTADSVGFHAFSREERRGFCRGPIVMITDFTGPLPGPTDIVEPRRCGEDIPVDRAIAVVPGRKRDVSNSLGLKLVVR